MLKHFAVCLVFISVLGCGTNPYTEDRKFKKVSFSKMIKNLDTYARPNALLTFEAVIESVSAEGEVVWLETDSKRVQFTIVTADQSIGKKNKIAELHVNQKYIFRCRMRDIGTFILPTDQRGMSIAVEFITDANGQVLYPPILID